MAVERGRRKPELDWPPLNVFHTSESQFDAGIEEHEFESGPTLRVYSPARTVADCFKFRNRIGLDVAMEALREGWRYKRFTMDEVYQHAGTCRVQKVMLPYLEMLQ